MTVIDIRVFPSYKKFADAMLAIKVTPIGSRSGDLWVLNLMFVLPH